MSLNHRTIISKTVSSSAMFEMQQLATFDVSLVKSRFSQCSGLSQGSSDCPRTIEFRMFSSACLALLYFTQNVHRGRLADHMDQVLVSVYVDQQMDVESLCKAKRGCMKKHSKFDLSGTVRWPKPYANRYFTRHTSKSCTL